MNTLTKGAIALSSIGLVATGAAVSNASADPAGGNETPASSSDHMGAAAKKARVFAVIRADGTRARGRGVVSQERLSDGTYEVRFDRRIGGCVWLGSLGLPGFVSSPSPGGITVTGRNGTKNGLFVETTDVDGNNSDRPFHVVVICS